MEFDFSYYIYAISISGTAPICSSSNIYLGTVKVLELELEFPSIITEISDYSDS